MKKEEFNTLLDIEFTKVLKPLGFKKNGVHYYLYEPPLIMQLQNGWKFSDELLLSFTFDFLCDVIDDNQNISLPQNIDSFPISIPLHILKQQYKSHKTVKKFRFDLNFITRTMLTTRHIYPLDFRYFTNEFFTPKNLTQEYIKESLSILLEEGMTLKKEMNPEVAYLALSKYGELRNNPYSSADPTNKLNEMKEKLKEKILKNGKNLPSREFGFFEKVQIYFHRKRYPEEF